MLCRPDVAASWELRTASGRAAGVYYSAALLRSKSNFKSTLVSFAAGLRVKCL